MAATARLTEPYAQIITQFLAQEYPGSVLDGAAVFEAVAAEFFATKQVRFGPMPPVEQQVVIRDIIRRYMGREEPIEVLVPWGSSKQGDGGVDVLELSALRMLNCLHTRVQKHYKPGIHVVLRLEDATDMVLFPESFYPKIQAYAHTLERLVAALGYTEIEVRPETRILSESLHDWRDQVDELSPIIARHMKQPSGKTRADLKAIGWTGDLIGEQVEYYFRAYKIFYPTLSDHEIFDLIGRYFGCSLARRQFRASGTNKPHVMIAFALPVPGIPWTMAQNRLYYRTLPERWTNQHKAPWIGQGYVQISNDNHCKVKLANFNEKLPTQPYTAMIGDVPIEAPYVLL